MDNVIGITSFGYLHGSAPEAHITIDLRQHFRDPHVNPELRELTGLNEDVRRAVLGTPGIYGVTDHLALVVRGFERGPGTGPIQIAIGCAGGRHRSVVVAAELASLTGGVVNHRDLDKPVVQRTA